MNIFLSAETAGAAASKWFELQKEFTRSLQSIGNVDYGESLTTISIVSIVMPPEFFENDGYKERKYYSRKNKMADIRLRMNYAEFVKADREKRRELYMAHIIECIRIAGEKAGTGFDLKQLIYDVENTLHKTEQ